ncbi:hypothetical protein ACFYWO_30760 [Streptomyces sp. NPDC002932]|uniref:hypothetical protein n=1 Tax=Streptomyces sp. NPDC002932 TaxID=3364672 RepID=UPI0036CDD01E
MSTLQTEVLLETRIADKAGVPVDDVRDVFTEYGLPLVVSPARPRSLRVHRLRVVGERTGDVEPGPFNTPMTFSAGLTALVASNFRGKTSVLELLTWCLRGTPRSEMQNRVCGWLRQVDLDATIAGEAMGFRLDLADGEITSAAVLTGKDAAALADVRAPDPARGVTALLRAASTDSYAEQIAGLMLGRMDLQPLVNSFKETSTQTHGWPAYFGAVYLPAGGDKALLGEVATNGLPGRLLQVFLDLPAAAALTRVKAVRDVRVAEAKARRSAAQAEAAERALEREHLETELSRARDHLADLLPDSENDTPLVDLASAAVQLARTLADAQQAWDEASTTFRRARTERQQAAKLLNDVTESATARLLFHGLNPSSCPRCDQAIDDTRRQQEHQSSTCAVCAREVSGDDEEPQEVTDEARERLATSTTVEVTAKEALERAEETVDSLTRELEAAETQLRRARSAAQLPARLAAQEKVLRLEGALSVFREPETPAADTAEARAVTILTAAASLLDQDSKDAAAALFQEVNQEIAELAILFGVPSLEKVAIDRSARLRIFPLGSKPEWFTEQSAGARLRLRIAVVIALLRVGRRYGVSTHPGLLLIDSPKSEEMQSDDARELFTELASVAAESDLQVVITTADFDLAQATLPAPTIRQAEVGASLW